ncbi:52 kDa repressor of the inhibitor of the protein kinase-like [Aphis craccivora]|uniref:52 kDa repressor of the inhibitor of the protein kinase-like n=1 Tax=Aphis craccivora TaxID=307492 RepID=A0A6G0Y8D2_APHCR|nr:52 kDa repressor of the inhibitor of the protein kinase-like [Aphis craccivora]
MSQKRLTGLALLNIHRNIPINTIKVIEIFKDKQKIGFFYLNIVICILVLLLYYILIFILKLLLYYHITLF